MVKLLFGLDSVTTEIKEISRKIQRGKRVDILPTKQPLCSVCITGATTVDLSTCLAIYGHGNHFKSLPQEPPVKYFKAGKEDKTSLPSFRCNLAFNGLMSLS